MAARALGRAAGPLTLTLVSLFISSGCGVAPNREPQSVLKPMLAEANGLMGQLGAGRIVDGPTRVHCNMARNNDPTVRWQLFARAPLNPSTAATVANVVAARRSAGWAVEDKGTGVEKTYLLRKAGIVLTVTYLQNGRGDIVLSGQTECFVASGGA